MTALSPWLTVTDADEALAFYEAAFGAVAVELHCDPDGVLQVAHVCIGEADFWIENNPAAGREPARDRPVRMILSVDDPDTEFAQAVAAGATTVSPVYEGHGWRIGRLADPFGHDWEIGRRLES